MTDISDQFNIIQQEETDYRSALSESMFTRLGGMNNALRNRLNQIYRFVFLGTIRPIVGGEDGTFTDIWPFEIVGVSGYIRDAGSSGTTSIDIHLVTGAGDQGSILASPITIANSTVNGSRFYKNLIDATSAIPAGITVPTVSTVNFAAGDTLRTDIDAKADGAQDLVLQLHYRARTP